jgi:hypothetical protein
VIDRLDWFSSEVLLCLVGCLSYSIIMISRRFQRVYVDCDSLRVPVVAVSSLSPQKFNSISFIARVGGMLRKSKTLDGKLEMQSTFQYIYDPARWLIQIMHCY